ncbi:MAG: hypothetical protein J7L47_09670 [Candidatus Odinarchaeota archaeon]|nr:hypothetical protein [Candidatus Odinarchaeota archaeon]
MATVSVSVEKENVLKVRCFVCGRPLEVRVSEDGSTSGGVFIVDGYSHGGQFKGFWLCDSCTETENFGFED